MTRPDDHPNRDATASDADPTMMALVEGRLSDAEVRAWRETASPQRRAEADGIVRMRGHLRGLAPAKAPPEVMRAVERRLRRHRRVRGTPDTPQRLVWEAVVNVMLLIGLFVVYLFGMPERDTRPLRPLSQGTSAARGSWEDTARAVLAAFGDVRSVEGDGLSLAVTVPVARQAALRAELVRYPFLQLVSATTAGDVVVVTVRVAE